LSNAVSASRQLLDKSVIRQSLLAGRWYTGRNHLRESLGGTQLHVLVSQMYCQQCKLAINALRCTAAW